MRTVEMSWSLDGRQLVCRWVAAPERADGRSGSILADGFGVARARHRSGRFHRFRAACQDGGQTRMASMKHGRMEWEEIGGDARA
jgi:hypothetical protein